MKRTRKLKPDTGEAWRWTVRGEFTTGSFTGWTSVGRGICEAIFRDAEIASQFVDRMDRCCSNGPVKKSQPVARK